MSSQPERTEKTCLNCQADLVGRFCHVCGQENIVTKQNFWSLVTHFIYDIVHFDGKFFETLKYLLLSPGRVPKEFIAGRRASFLQPIRMYLFTSALFFLFFFSTANLNFETKEEPLTPEDKIEVLNTYREYAEKNPSDSMVKQKIMLLETPGLRIMPSDLFAGMPFQINGRLYRSVTEYDSVQRSLPDSAKDNRIQRIFTRKLISLHVSKGLNPNAAFSAFMDEFVHKFPYMLFVSLPLFAAMLKLLYIRRKHLFYSDHAIFTIYYYIISFILLFFLFGLKELDGIVNWRFLRYPGLALAIWVVIYLFISMKRFYGQSWGKTFFKFLLLLISATLILFMLFLAFIFITAYQL